MVGLLRGPSQGRKWEALFGVAFLVILSGFYRGYGSVKRFSKVFLRFVGDVLLFLAFLEGLLGIRVYCF